MYEATLYETEENEEKKTATAAATTKLKHTDTLTHRRTNHEGDQIEVNINQLER